MNEKSNRYAIAALKDKRASLASEIIMLKRQLRHRKEAMAHVDATLKLLDPSAVPSAIPPKRRVTPKRVRLFRSGELGALPTRGIMASSSRMQHPARSCRDWCVRWQCSTTSQTTQVCTEAVREIFRSLAL